MDSLTDSLLAEWHNLIQVLPRIALALLVVAISFVIGRLLGRTVERLARRSDLSDTHGSFFRKLVTWTVVFFGTLVALNLVGLRTVAAGLITGGGVTAVVLGFAFREIGENFLAGFFLAFSRPFKVGDMIESGGLRGVVRSIELRYTHVRSADGRDIFIPSSQLFKDPLINFTRDGLRRFSFTVGIDYGDDPSRAVTLLLESVKKVDGVLDDPAPGVVVAGLLDSWVQLEVFYWIDSSNTAYSVGSVQTATRTAVRNALLANDYTVSANTVSNIALRSSEPVDVALSGGTPAARHDG